MGRSGEDLFYECLDNLSRDYRKWKQIPETLGELEIIVRVCLWRFEEICQLKSSGKEF